MISYVCGVCYQAETTDLDEPCIKCKKGEINEK